MSHSPSAPTSILRSHRIADDPRDDDGSDEGTESQSMLEMGEKGLPAGFGEYGSVIRNRTSVVLRCCKWALLLGLFFFSLVALIMLYRRPVALEPGDDVWGAIPRPSHQNVVFEDEVEMFTPNYTSEAHSLEVLDRWRSLVPKGSGNIKIGDLDQYSSEIPQPYKIKGFGEIYMASWVHQLRCLYHVMDAYDQLIRLGPTGAESMARHGHQYPSTRQCYDYLRQAILCHADSTLEGASGTGPPRGTDGYGFNHVCRNREESVKWMESRRPFDEQDILGEGE